MGIDKGDIFSKNGKSTYTFGDYKGGYSQRTQLMVEEEVEVCVSLLFLETLLLFL